MSLTRRQIATRKRGVGGSEMFAALGKDSRCSRLELYMRKVGELPEPDFSDDERVHFGNVLEPVLRQEFSRRIGQKVLTPRRTLVHESAPIVASPDGWIPALNEGVELKTADKFEAEEFGEPDTDQVPLRYVVQCMTYMSVTKAGKWYLAVLIGGNDFRIYEIPRDEQLIDAIEAGAREFWTHVEERRPPDPATPEDVKLRWPRDIGSSIVVTDDIAAACAELKELKALLKQAVDKEAALKAQIQTYMTEAANLVDADGREIATWRKAKDSQKFDDKRFAAEEPALYERYLKPQQGSRRFLLK